MLTIWKCLIQSKLDFTSQLCSPSDQANIADFESVATKGRLQNRKLAKLGTLSQQEGGRSEGLPKCPNTYF